MKVSELKAELENLPNDMEIILQKDAEGNGYSPLEGADSDAVYVKMSEWYGDVYSIDWSASDADMTEDEWAQVLKKPLCLVLYPVN